MGKHHTLLAGWLIDGTGQEILKNRALDIEDGIITAISSNENFSTDHLEDLSHCTLLPPLFDCVVYLLKSSIQEQNTGNSLSPTSDQQKDTFFRNSYFHSSHGVLGVGDFSISKDQLTKYQQRQQRHIPDPLTIKTGETISCTHGQSGDKRNPVRSPDCIRIINSERVESCSLSPNLISHHNTDALQHLVGLAKQQHKKIRVVANGEEPVRAALKAGCHVIEQGYFMGEDNLKRMADAGITWIPMAIAMKSCIARVQYPARKAIRDNLKRQLDQLNLAHTLGVKVATGTGAGTEGIIHGETVVGEMKLLIKAGFSLAEAVQCATINGAELLDIDHLGALVPGRPANFLVCRGTPAQLPRKLSYLENVYIDGKPSPAYRKNPVKTVFATIEQGQRSSVA